MCFTRCKIKKKFKQRQNKRKTEKQEQKKEKNLLCVALCDLTEGAGSLNWTCADRGFPIFIFSNIYIYGTLLVSLNAKGKAVLN